MHRHLPILLASLLLLSACDRQRERAQPPAATDTAAPSAQPAVQLPPDLRARAEAFVAAWNANDPDVLVGFFTEEATISVADSTYEGREDIRRRWLPNAGSVNGLRFDEPRVEPAGEDYTVAGRHVYTVQPPEGGPYQVTGTHTFTWTRDEDGVWRIRAGGTRDDP